MLYANLQWYWKWLCLIVYHSASGIGEVILKETRLVIKHANEMAIARANHRQMARYLENKIPE